MSPRPRTVSDAEILAATHRAISRLGPQRMTLADVGAEAGLAPATLIQRFGSKRELLLALARAAAQSVDEGFERLRERHESPLAALIAGATVMTRMTKTPEELANGVAFLQMDLSDREFHAHALRNSERIVAGYEKLVAEAVASGELRRCDATAIARAVAALAFGSLIGWAIHRRGDAESWVRADLDTLLAPYRVATKARRRGSIGKSS